MSQPDFQLDPRLVRRRAGRAATEYAGVDPLAREISRRMAERLAYIRIEPRRILDLGCGPGSDLAALAERYPGAPRVAVDVAQAMLTQARGEKGFLKRLLGLGKATAPDFICADAAALPLERGCMSLVWSNLMLQWMHDPLPALKEIHRVLEVGGMLMFSTLGPDTLKELRAALPPSRHEHLHRFIDMHDLGDALVNAGFSDPVMDMEMITVTYTRLDDLFHDLRASGSGNAAQTRPRSLTGKAHWTSLRSNYEQLRREGRLPATVEVVYGHAWKAAPKVSEDGRPIIRFEPRKPA
ncbi:malonyl-ACP O-methyltransferase BioC [Zoogloea sp.]|uniref:malonyl-ACP O-methyltransferase BioC n=1 Tax=Zoogloea sp. TaxID=49181 RepID=UPI0026081EEA|nr:malonyl-ACP O-methyltransferase BioC [Zoogloea sp.]MDD3353549.1 malonyl-ACP O-methyltransferase BioC [Zoogloea sp.]